LRPRTAKYPGQQATHAHKPRVYVIEYSVDMQTEVDLC